MPTYKYQAITREGTIVKGEIEASHLDEFFQALYQEGLIPLKYRTKISFIEDYFKKIKRKELAEFLHNLAFLISAGVPLISALQDLRDSLANPLLKRKVQFILSEVLKGNPLSEAFKAANIFPPIVISLTKIGEETGRLDNTLEEASKHIYRVDEIISQTKRAMIYPLFVIFSISGAFLFWLIYVLPKILEVFKQMQIKLPLPTIILMKVVNFLQNHYIILFTLIISIILCFIILYKHPKTQDKVERVLLKLPFIGFVKRSGFMAFFFEYFSLLLEAGVDILRSFDIMYESVNTQLYKKIVKKMKEKVMAGFTLSEGLGEEKIFRPFDIRLVNIGEQTGRLPEQMKMLANHYFNEVQNLIQTLSKVLEPAIIVIAGILFLIIIIALIGPVYELISQIGRLG
jgi:type II secretory pathway component PulF